MDMGRISGKQDSAVTVVVHDAFVDEKLTQPETLLNGPASGCSGVEHALEFSFGGRDTGVFGLSGSSVDDDSPATVSRGEEPDHSLVGQAGAKELRITILIDFEVTEDPASVDGGAREVQVKSMADPRVRTIGADHPGKSCLGIAIVRGVNLTCDAVRIDAKLTQRSVSLDLDALFAEPFDQGRLGRGLREKQSGRDR